MQAYGGRLQFGECFIFRVEGQGLGILFELRDVRFRISYLTS